MQTLEKRYLDKVMCDMENFVDTVENRLLAAILSAMDILVIPLMEAALRTADASSTRNINSVVLDPDQHDFSRDIHGLQITASSRYNSNTNLKNIVEAGDLPVTEINFDRETHNLRSTL